MPVIHTYTSTAVSREQRESLKATFGQAIEAVPGKSEQWLMCLFEDEVPIYHAGTDDEPAALVTVDVYATSPVPGEAWNEMTGQVTGALRDVLGIDPARVYLKYGPTPDFGWNGSNF